MIAEHAKSALPTKDSGQHIGRTRFVRTAKRGRYCPGALEFGSLGVGHSCKYIGPTRSSPRTDLQPTAFDSPCFVWYRSRFSRYCLCIHCRAIDQYTLWEQWCASQNNRAALYFRKPPRSVGYTRLNVSRSASACAQKAWWHLDEAATILYGTNDVSMPKISRGCAPLDGI